jgi:hypothetical protein
VKAEELKGEALQIFEAWLMCGYTEEQALQEVRHAGFGDPPDPYDDMVASFQAMGLSEKQARAAATGRDLTESAARRGFAEPAKTTKPRPVKETRQAGAARKVVPLAERFEPGGLPPIVARADELMRQGVLPHEAPLRAYQDLYGHDPKGVA